MKTHESDQSEAMGIYFVIKPILLLSWSIENHDETPCKICFSREEKLNYGKESFLIYVILRKYSFSMTMIFS